MKIAHFTGTLKKEDGVTTVILSLINEGLKNGIESIVVTGWAEDESITKVPVIQLPSISFPMYKEYKFPIPYTHSFEKQLNEFKPDIIHIHSPDTTAWLALRYAKKNKIPVVATHHTNFKKYLEYYYLSLFKSLVDKEFKSLYSKMMFVTTPSQTANQELCNLGLKNILTIPWGVDSNIFNQSFRSEEWRNKILNGSKKKILLYAGRLTWEKDFHTFIETYNLLKNKRNDFIVIIAGDGPIRKELESLMPEVIFLGHQEKEEFSRIYASADILFFPSSTEVFANVPLEAMSSGLIPVLADVGAIKILIENKNIGMLCKPKNPEDFYNKINILLDNEELQKEMQTNCLNFIKDYTWEKVFKNILEKYKEISLK